MSTARRRCRVVPLLVIGGPTATRKTDLALRVARAVGGEIISADSMQIYRGLNIGVAKPGAAQRAAARFHLVDFVAPDEPYTVADFQRDARRAIVEALGRGALPILCGGTGLYLRAVLEHFAFPPAAPHRQREVREALERELAAVGGEAMHRRLAAADPQAAARIAPGDARRITRALEVLALCGAPAGNLPRVDENPAVQYNRSYHVLSRPRPDLYRDIEGRVDDMVAAGWLEEVAWLRAQGYGPALQSMQAIGYRDLLRWLMDNQTGGRGAVPEQVIATIKRDTRRFAKRQLTWFRREVGARWLQWADDADFETVVRLVIRDAQRLRDEAGPPGAVFSR